jgi:predicted nucleic-acid-binding protein
MGPPMKAIDTNVLVRFLTQDDRDQCLAVQARFLSAQGRGETFYVSWIVLLELMWVLRQIYGRDRKGCLEMIETLLATQVLVMEDRALLLDLVRLGRTATIDLDDLFIGFAARRAGCEATLTFDRTAAKLELFEAL